MQCPPTNPGLKFKKFHLVPAAFNTSLVSIFNKLKIFANSLTKAILISLWEFSITFAASAILIEGAKYVPASIIELYNLSIINAEYLFDPDVIFKIFVRVLFLSPGLILSGEYPT